MSKAAKSPWFLMRFFSNRGTDQRIVVKLKAGTNEMQALAIAREWAEDFTRGTACHEYTVEVERITKLPRSVWIKRWVAACKRREKANDEWQTLRAMGSGFDWSKGSRYT